MDSPTPENRSPAPGVLRVVQEFLNSGHLAASVRIAPDVAGAIRLRREAGESQALLASEYGVGQKLVAALGRGANPGDDLATPGEAREWLASRGLLFEDATLDERELERLRELRELLRALAEANNGQPLGPDVLPSLDRLAARTPMGLRFENERQAALEPVAEGGDAAIGRLLVIVFDAMRDGTFQRLKRCPGDGCPHTFYDASRNRTGTWCAMSVCGNRTKVRSYQSRRRAVRRTPIRQ